MDCIHGINEKIVQLKTGFEDKSKKKNEPPKDVSQTDEYLSVDSKEEGSAPPSLEEIHKGRLLFDATVCPQDIAYPTDLDLLSESREVSEHLIDRLYYKCLHGEKPHT